MLRPDPLWCKGIAQDGVGWMSDLSSFVSVFFLVSDSFFSNFVPIICDTRGRGESVRLYAITGEMGKERGKGEGAGRKNMTSTDAVDVAGVWDKRPLLRIDGEGSSVGPVATIGNNLLMRRV